MRIALISFALSLVPTTVRGQEAPAEPAPPVLVLVVPATQAPSAQALTVVDAPSPPTLAEPAASLSTATDEVTATDEDPEELEPGWLSLGISVLVGTRPSPGGLEPTFLGGFDVGFRLDEHFALGLRRTHVSGGSPFVSVGTSPYLELGVRPWERLDLYGQLGAALGVLVPTQDRDVDLELAPFAAAGARFYAVEFFSIAIEGSLHVPLAGGLGVGDALLPALSVHFSGGLAVAFHLS